jgi:hypothetical protein
MPPTRHRRALVGAANLREPRDLDHLFHAIVITHSHGIVITRSTHRDH